MGQRSMKISGGVNRTLVLGCSCNSGDDNQKLTSGKLVLTCNLMVASLREMDAVFKALADESRRKLLDQLHKNNGQTLGELCEHLDMTRQAVTKHLLLLEAASLVAVVWRGREKLHYLNPVPLHEISERWIGKYERHRLQALGDLKKGLEENKNRKG